MKTILIILSIVIGIACLSFLNPSGHIYHFSIPDDFRGPLCVVIEKGGIKPKRIKWAEYEFQIIEGRISVNYHVPKSAWYCVVAKAFNGDEIRTEYDCSDKVDYPEPKPDDHVLWDKGIVRQPQLTVNSWVLFYGTKIEAELFFQKLKYKNPEEEIEIVRSYSKDDLSTYEPEVLDLAEDRKWRFLSTEDYQNPNEQFSSKKFHLKSMERSSPLKWEIVYENPHYGKELLVTIDGFKNPVRWSDSTSSDGLKQIVN